MTDNFARLSSGIGGTGTGYSPIAEMAKHVVNSFTDHDEYARRDRLMQDPKKTPLLGGAFGDHEKRITKYDITLHRVKDDRLHQGSTEMESRNYVFATTNQMFEDNYYSAIRKHRYGGVAGQNDHFDSLRGEYKQDITTILQGSLTHQRYGPDTNYAGDRGYWDIGRDSNENSAIFGKFYAKGRPRSRYTAFWRPYRPHGGDAVNTRLMRFLLVDENPSPTVIRTQARNDKVDYVFRGVYKLSEYMRLQMFLGAAVHEATKTQDVTIASSEDLVQRVRLFLAKKGGKADNMLMRFGLAHLADRNGRLRGSSDSKNKLVNAIHRILLPNSSNKDRLVPRGRSMPGTSAMNGAQKTLFRQEKMLVEGLMACIIDTNDFVGNRVRIRWLGPASQGMEADAFAVQGM